MDKVENPKKASIEHMDLTDADIDELQSWLASKKVLMNRQKLLDTIEEEKRNAAASKKHPRVQELFNLMKKNKLQTES